MKKIVLALVVLLSTSPAWALTITAAQVGDTNEVIISYDASVEAPDMPRAFGLDIQLDNDATILEVTPMIVGESVEPDNLGFGIFPGTIVIDAEGNVTDDGTPVAPSDDPGALPGIDSNGVTIELASLYSPTGVGSPNVPPAAGDLVSLRVSKSCTLCVSANVPRAGATGVVMEDPDQVVTVNLPVCIPVSLEPECWSYVGQPCGDSDGSGMVNIADLVALKASWLKSTGQEGYNPCADFDHSGMVNIADLVKLKAYWLKTVPPCP